MFLQTRQYRPRSARNVTFQTIRSNCVRQLALCVVVVLMLGVDSLLAQAPSTPTDLVEPPSESVASPEAPQPSEPANPVVAPLEVEAADTTPSPSAAAVAPAPAPAPAPDMPLTASTDTTQLDGDDQASDAPSAYVVPPLTFKLSDDGKTYLRLLVWTQVWVRAMELNPGTQLKGSNADWIGDVALRRTRFLVFGKLTPEILIQIHVGVNNQTFEGERKPQLFVHSAWGQYDVLGNYLTVGAGLHYWNGISRLTNSSTIRFLGLDGPILNWPTVDASDQFAHHLGAFAKGQIGSFDYRLAVNRPFTSDAPLQPGVTNFDVRSTSLAFAGYFQWMFGEIESNLLPYETGSYLGTKRVFNIGVGGHYQANAMARCDVGADGMCGTGKQSYDMTLFGADVFADTPVGDGAITAYGVYYYYDFGPDFLRHIGIMALGQPGGRGGVLSGAGNRYPVIGTGHHVFVQTGYLLPWYLGTTRLQPYASLQLSMMEALADPMIVPELGVNWFLAGHNAKITLNYRNRPLFAPARDGAEPEADGRASELIAQLQLAI